MRIGIETLAVSYERKRVIDGLSLEIPSGTFFTLLGPSGCGKTTLLRAIAGFVDIDDGRLMFGTKDVTRQPAYKRNIGMVFQDYALFPDKTVFDNVAYGLRARREPEAAVRKKVDEALDRVGLGAFGARLPAALSGGQRQRVALVRAMVIAPDVLLMDEPLSNLDAKLRHQVRETIMQLQRESNVTTIFVTHDQDEALAMSDRIGVVNAGRLEQVGTPVEIYREPRTAYVADFIGAANLLDVTIAEPASPNVPARIAVAGASIAARVLAPFQPGVARLVIRPEDVKIAPGIATGVGQLAARIQRRQYLGGKTSYAMILEGGTPLRVDSSDDGHDGYAVGDAVVLTLDAHKTLVLPA
ncbi:MAG: ABC transporter ATP-binding protein [Rhizobiales bacterium]|nr:ABC transporter ATP-binding protein [Hyphomicrobiales bacterium]